MKYLLLSAFTALTINGLAQVDLYNNLKVCMPFNSNANDFSGNLNHGTVSSASLTSDRFGNPNSAYSFDRNQNSFISISSFANIAPTNELTISMWAKSDVTTSSCLFMLNPNNASDRCVGCAQYLNGGSTMMVWDYGDLFSGGRTLVTSIPADIVNWHHYVYVVSESGNIKKMYLDGIIQSSSTYSLSCTNKNFPFYIGGGFATGGNSKITWAGKIDDVCIYNRALFANEVSALFNLSAVCSFDLVGINNLKKASTLLVYPTVSEDGIYNLMDEKESTGSLEIFAMDGKLIESYSGNIPDKIDLKSAEKGIYFLVLQDKGMTTTQKIIKN